MTSCFVKNEYDYMPVFTARADSIFANDAQ